MRTVNARAISSPDVRSTRGRMPGDGRPPSWRIAICRMRHCHPMKSSRNEEAEVLVAMMGFTLFPARKNYFVWVDEFHAVT
jgi:hypothetical protein